MIPWKMWDEWTLPFVRTTTNGVPSWASNSTSGGSWGDRTRHDFSR